MDNANLSVTLMGAAYAFVLIMCRCGAAIMLLPPFSEDGPPALLRVGFAMALTVLLLPVIGPRLPPAPERLPLLAALLCGELLAGFVLGWLARLVCLALPAAGQLISLATGLSSVLQPDSNFGAQTAGLGLILGRLMPVLVLVSGLYVLPLTALAGSYDIIPPGKPLSSADLTNLAVSAVSLHTALALRLAAPFLLIGAIWQIALGLLSRLVPQIQIYFAALPGQVLGGLLLLTLLSATLARLWSRAAEDAFTLLPGN
jgi:flagellar biosynthetic protein FliR